MRVLVSLVACLICACSSLPIIGKLSPQAAQREAHRDIASGHMKIYTAGTIARSEVGIAPEDKGIIRKLPRDDSLPAGCTVPEAGPAIDYARAYNREIVRYVRTHPQT
jgi:hypothetical protein